MRRLNHQLFCCHLTSSCSVRNFSNGLFSRNFYEVLGVERNASQSDIKKAFYTLSKKYHPDIVFNCNDAVIKNNFLQIKEAYDILKNEESRRLYDKRTNPAGFSYSGGFSQSQNQRGCDRTGAPIRKVSKEFAFRTQVGRFYNPTEEMKRQQQEKWKFYLITGIFVTFALGSNAIYVWWFSNSKKHKEIVDVIR